MVSHTDWERRKDPSFLKQNKMDFSLASLIISCLIKSKLGWIDLSTQSSGDIGPSYIPHVTGETWIDQNTWEDRRSQIFTANPTNSFEVLLKRHDFPFSSFYLAFVFWPKALPDTLGFLGVFLKRVVCWLLCLTQEAWLPLLFFIPFFLITTNTVFLSNSNKKDKMRKRKKRRRGRRRKQSGE